MSWSSAAKKARRKKRLTARNGAWLSDEVHADVKGVARIANHIIPRGWEFDRDLSSDDVVTWYYPPSGTDHVTRIWLNDPDEPHVLLAGSAEDDPGVALTVDELFARLPGIETHRA